MPTLTHPGARGRSLSLALARSLALSPLSKARRRLLTSEEQRELQQKNGVVFEKTDLASGVMGTQI